MFNDDKINYFYSDIFYSLDEAVRLGKLELYNFCCDYYDQEEVSKGKLYKFYHDKNLYYDFTVSVVSGSRKRFDTSDEVMEYFNKCIDHIPDNKLYDFLLTLVECVNRYYRYDGKLKGGEPVVQCPRLERAFARRVYFSMESCQRRNWYIFEYTTSKDYKI